MSISQSRGISLLSCHFLKIMVYNEGKDSTHKVVYDAVKAKDSTQVGLCRCSDSSTDRKRANVITLISKYYITITANYKSNTSYAYTNVSARISDFVNWVYKH
jgi:hypothetical protein